MEAIGPDWKRSCEERFEALLGWKGSQANWMNPRQRHEKSALAGRSRR
jgi:hypothetical protein